jgi:hypothetical protein
VKILFCIKALNNPGGGAERVLAEISGGLTKLGHQVAVLTFDPPGGESSGRGLAQTRGPLNLLRRPNFYVGRRRQAKRHRLGIRGVGCQTALN